VQAGLRAAGFDVYVYQNDPAVDPETFAPIEYLVNGALVSHPTTYYPPSFPADYPLVFFIGGTLKKTGNFIDWGMEHFGSAYWPESADAIVTKVTNPVQGGMRSMMITGDSATVSEQQQQPDADDADLITFYRATVATTATGERIPAENPINLLRDGNAERPAVTAWTSSNATLTKQTAQPDPPVASALCLRVAATVGNFGWARQTVLLAGRTYLLEGHARSVDGVAAPVINDGWLDVWTGTRSTNWQPFSEMFVANLDGPLSFGSDTAGGSVEYDNLVLYDIAAPFQGATPVDVTAVLTPWIDGALFASASPSSADCLDDHVQDGDFDDDAHWTEGALWTVNEPANRAEWNAAGAPGAASGNLTQSGADTAVGVVLPGRSYRLTYTLAAVVNTTITPSIGGTAGTARAVAGTYVELLQAGTDDEIDFFADTVSPAGGSAQLSAVRVELVDEIWRNESLTIETVISMTTTAGVQTIAASGEGPMSSRLYVEDGMLTFADEIQGVGVAVVVEAAITAGQTRHVVAARSYDAVADETTLDLYVDGALADTRTHAGQPLVIEDGIPWIGAAGAANPLNGTLIDHIAFYADGKDAAWAAEKYQEHLDALFSGPHVAQELDPEITDARTLTAACWAWEAPDGDPFPLILVRLPSGEWQVAHLGAPFSVDPQGLQSASHLLPDGISEARLYTKGTSDGACAFDDVTVGGLEINRADVPLNMRDKFLRMVLASKPAHSWAGLLVDFK
jgi:hypothetical protein